MAEIPVDDTAEAANDTSNVMPETANGTELAMSDNECLEAMRKFAEITQTDEACAHFFLQDVGWKLERALECYSATQTMQQKNCNVENEREIPTNSKISDTSPTKSLLNNFSLTLLSWNIDGIDRANLSTRFTAVCYIISKIEADVIFLQEVTPELVTPLKTNLGSEYSILIATPDKPYFTVVLLKPVLKLITHTAIPYEQTGMGRAMHMVEAELNGRSLKLLNTHLESMKESEEIRKKQLKECFDLIEHWGDENTTIIFGGDLNIRDHEIDRIPDGFQDVWVAAGSKPEFRYSWNMQKNDNKSCGKARCRFDRIYFKSGGAFSKVDLSFEGQNRIRSSLCFPSDHFALIARFT